MNLDAARDEPRTPHGSSDDPDVLDFSANCNPLIPDGVGRVYREAFDAARTYPAEPRPTTAGRPPTTSAASRPTWCRRRAGWRRSD